MAGSGHEEESVHYDQELQEVAHLASCDQEEVLASCGVEEADPSLTLRLVSWSQDLLEYQEWVASLSLLLSEILSITTLINNVTLVNTIKDNK